MLNIIPSKPKSMKLSDYFELRENNYEILRLIPTKSNRNIKTYQIAERCIRDRLNELKDRVKHS